MSNQKTIAKEVYIEGVGLHTGNMTRATFKPAPANSGITFVRVDLPEKPRIKASLENVQGITRGTTLGKEPFGVHTVEHLLAACSGLSIDNLEVLLTNNEPPVLDGGAKPFAELLASAGLVEQNEPRKCLRITKPIVYESGTTRITAEPSDDFMIDCTISYKHPALTEQHAAFKITKEIFISEIAPARTFCFDYEIEALKNKGLAKGGDLSNAIVVGLNGIHNPDKNLRFKDEFVRHKILDMIGDFYLLGMPVKGKITALRCGHGHNINFAKEILKNAVIENEASIEINKTEEKQMENASSVPGKMMDIVAIQKSIPHRYPFLMIDKVLITEELKTATGYKCVSGNENFFQGHFPGQPIMPGVLIVEAMAQTSCVLLLSRPDLKNKLAYFMSIDNVKFRKPVVPGDLLELKIEVLRVREKGGKVRGEAFVNGELTTEAEFMFVIVDREA